MHKSVIVECGGPGVQSPSQPQQKCCYFQWVVWLTAVDVLMNGLGDYLMPLIKQTLNCFFANAPAAPRNCNCLCHFFEIFGNSVYLTKPKPQKYENFNHPVIFYGAVHGVNQNTKNFIHSVMFCGAGKWGMIESFDIEI